MSAFSFAGNWLGHSSAREATVRDDPRIHTYAITHLLTEKNEQRSEIEKLKSINTELEDKVQILRRNPKIV